MEDDPAHAALIKRGLGEGDVPHQIIHLTNGEAALDFLFRRGEHDAAPRPHVVLLDLHLPRVHGLEVLRRIRDSSELRLLPVVVLTTSEAEQDVAGAYEYRANSYVVKPLDFQRFRRFMQAFRYYWLEWNHYPWI
ncbi:response regulator [Rhodocaloribacter litoris]|uniref:response regulator n=1 Tax=Rhodocaloribacter litoris TaxID=2558931 RepID=UPI0021D473AF|nr:response regulator [Rhodocaloribacter litoris]QXD14951.1 response regulator [Rhodocaloribacter litoris]